ncbi:MAG: ribosome silencing factor [Peptococcaceae bacterium]|jgi:ribosome-associated protein|nr:ribosome silencing factor [Peptococcaceae bacterium]
MPKGFATGKEGALTLDGLTLVQAVVDAAGEKKADDVVVLDIGKVSVICDFFVIATGRSTTQVKAVADHIEERLLKAGARLSGREGYREGRWILLDFYDVVVHVFLQAEREFYNLERVWQDARVVSLGETGGEIKAGAHSG